MTLPQKVLAVLAAVQLAACHDTTSCLPDPEAFSIDEPLSAEQLDMVMTIYNFPDRDAIVCEDACRVVYSGEAMNEAYGWKMDTVESCSLSLSTESNGGGHLNCTGMGFEYFGCATE